MLTLTEDSSFRITLIRSLGCTICCFFKIVPRSPKYLISLKFRLDSNFPSVCQRSEDKKGASGKILSRSILKPKKASSVNLSNSSLIEDKTNEDLLKNTFSRAKR